MKSPRIYLDNAATSWPKPSVVYDAVDDYQRRLGVAVGRGGYAAANEVAELVEAARQRIADLIHAGSASQVIFTFNCTDALNLAIHGILRVGDHVVTSTAEHNSVLRPLRWLEDRGGIRVTRVPCDPNGWVDPDGIRTAIRTDTKPIALTHVLNVTGTIQPINEVAQIARGRGVLFLVDAAQSMGHMPLSVEELGADLLAAAGHKGLLGPLGTGLLYIREGLETLVDPVRQGGTGSASYDDRQPLTLPTKYESGNPNAPGLVGLGAAVDYLSQRGIAEIHRHESALTSRLLGGLAEISGVRIHGAPADGRRLGVVSITLADRSSPEVAAILDQEYQIQVRAGFHCAALIHDTLGSRSSQGTIRFSVGAFNTEEDVDLAATAVAAIACGRTTTVAIPDTLPCVMAAEHHRGSLSGATPAAIPEAIPGLEDLIPGLEDLWNLSLGDPSICIAILDGPVDVTHPCFEGADLTYVPSAGPNADPNGAAAMHGTKVASLIFGQHDSGIKGIAPRCKGIIIPIFRDRDNGTIGACPQPQLAAAILKAAEGGAHIINISGGEFSPSGTAHPILADAVAKCVERGILIVAAAGNQGCQCLHIPASLPSVLAVGAMDREGEPMDFSNSGYGSEGVLAIGEALPVARVGDDAPTESGTSFATPIVAGLAALMMSVLRQQCLPHPAGLIRAAILTTAQDCSSRPSDQCDRLLAGRLDLPAALDSLIRKEVQPMSEHESAQPAPNSFPEPGQISPGTPRMMASPLSLGSNDSGAASGVRAAGLAPQPSSAATSPEPAPSLPPSGFHPAFQEALPVTGITAAACGTCNGGQAPLEKVFALGKLDFDYGNRARRAYFAKEFEFAGLGRDIDNAENLLNFLIEHPSGTSGVPYTILEGTQFPNRAKVTSITWTLKLDDTPIYAIQPGGAFAHEIHDTLVGFLKDEIDLNEKAERISVAGVIAGQTRLFTGEVVPVIVPDIRGMYCWKTSFLADAAIGIDLQLMSPVTDLGTIPTSGKNLVIVANVNRTIYFRIFDADGKMVVDTNESQLTMFVAQIAKLKEQLVSLWPPHELTRCLFRKSLASFLGVPLIRPGWV